MVLQISQETFDSVVKENVEEFDMGLEEAIKEAIQQFEIQGVDLSHISTEHMQPPPEDAHILLDALKALRNLLKLNTIKSAPEYITPISAIRVECSKGLQYRVLAGKEGAYDDLLKVLNLTKEYVEVSRETFRALTALMTKQPDLLTEEGVQIIIRFLDEREDLEVERWILKWVKECCMLHEMNRQMIFDAGILEHLKPHLEHATAPLLRDVLAVLRALVLDDDVRVEFGKAHDHARAIASDTLCLLTTLLVKFEDDEGLMNDVMLTLSTLLVRTEFCKKVEDAGGLELIQDTMKNFPQNDKLVRQCFKLLKALAGNDECKAHIIQKGAAPVMVACLDAHKDSAATVIMGLSCIAAITLRSPDNSKALFEAGIPAVIIESMKIHSDDESVQKNGSWAIRNMVSRSRYQNKAFLELGAEQILKGDLKKFKNCEYDMKSALRDLGCKVELKEEWTGKGGALNTQAKK